MVCAEGVGQRDEVVRPAVERPVRVAVRETHPGLIGADRPDARGFRRRIEELGLQATRRSTMIVQNEWPTVVTHVEVGDRSVADPEGSFTGHVRFLP